MGLMGLGHVSLDFYMPTVMLGKTVSLVGHNASSVLLLTDMLRGV